MKSRLKMDLSSCFSQELQARFPQFTLADQDRDWWAWAWKIAPNLSFFVTLQAMERGDQFVIEVAWSEDGQFPWGAMGKIKASQPQGRERLARLWERSAREPVWDLDPEMSEGTRKYLEALGRAETLAPPADKPAGQLSARVGPMVQDSLDRLEQYGLPRFRQVAGARGVEWQHS